MSINFPITKDAGKVRAIEKNMPIPTLIHPSTRRECGPAHARPAPAIPAMSAWLLLIGRPTLPAKVPQAITAIIAPATAGRVIVAGSTIPFPIVAATDVPKNAPTVLRIIAIAMATFTLSAPVATTVAIALGASVHPLMNSAQRARVITNRMPISIQSTCISVTPSRGRGTEAPNHWLHQSLPLGDGELPSNRHSR